MKNMNGFPEQFTGEEVSMNPSTNTANKVAFDKENVYNNLLQLSSKMNFWGEGLHKNEDWSF